MPEVEQLPNLPAALRSTPLEAQLASYLAESARIASFSLLFMPSLCHGLCVDARPQRGIPPYLSEVTTAVVTAPRHDERIAVDLDLRYFGILLGSDVWTLEKAFMLNTSMYS